MYKLQTTNKGYKPLHEQMKLTNKKQYIQLAIKK